MEQHEFLPALPDEASAPDGQEIEQMVLAALAGGDHDEWLGQLVLETHKATDRAVAWANEQAEARVAGAHAKAQHLRDVGRRRARLLSHVLSRGRPKPAVQDGASPAEGTPPAPRARLGPNGRPGHETPIPAPSNGRVSPAADGQAPVTPVPFRPPPLSEPARPKPVTAPAPAPATGPAPAPAVHPPLTGAAPLPSAGPPIGAPTVPDRPPHPQRHIDIKLMLAAVGIVAAVLGFVAFESYRTPAMERAAQHRLKTDFARIQTNPTANHAVLGLLSLPAAGVKDVAVVRGLSVDHLQQGPAYDTNSQLPGQPGPVLIFGHHDTYGGPFAHLADVRPGDDITLTTASGTFTYRVTRAPQVLGAGPHTTLQLPSKAEVAASGANTSNAGDALVVATGSGLRDSRLEVVVATLDRSSPVTSKPATSPSTATGILRNVPGQGSGLLWAILWILVIVAALWAAPRLSRNVPPAAVFVVAGLLAVVGVYQTYYGIDRLFPGTH